MSVTWKLKIAIILKSLCGLGLWGSTWNIKQNVNWTFKPSPKPHKDLSVAICKKIKILKIKWSKIYNETYLKENLLPTYTKTKIDINIYYENNKTSNFLMKNNPAPPTTDLCKNNIIYEFNCHLNNRNSKKI